MATVAILVINPAELFRSARDSTRLGELATLNKALQIVEISIAGASFGDSETVYISLPDTSPTCLSYTLPSLPSLWKYNCVSSVDLRKTDGSGWIPVDFDAVPITSLAVLPVDPVNTDSYYYAYVTGGSWTLSSLLESERHAEKAAMDGGPDPAQYEVGSDLTIAPFIRGMVGYWKLDGNLNDSSGVGNNGTIVGNPPFLTNCRIGQCLNPNGYSESVYAPIGTYFGGNNPLTAMAWVYAGSTSNGPVFGVTSSPPGSGWNMPFLSIKGSTVVGWIWGMNQLNSTVSLNTWHHLAITYTPSGSGQEIFYVDGTQVNSSATGQYSPSGGFDYWTTYLVGAKPPGVNPYFGGADGIIDEVRIYERVLTENEIKAIYDTTK